MLKAHHHILCLTTQQGDMLKQVQQEAAACWNAIVAEAKAGFMMLWKKHPQIPLPRFRIEHRQAFPKYRKRPLPACVDGSDVALSSLAISGPLRGEDIAA